MRHWHFLFSIRENCFLKRKLIFPRHGERDLVAMMDVATYVQRFNDIVTMRYPMFPQPRMICSKSAGGCNGRTDILADA